MELARFKEVVFGVSIHLGNDVLEIVEPAVTPNFYVAIINNRGNKFVVLATYDDDWAIASSYELSECKLTFIDNEDLAKVLKQSYGIELLKASKLDEPFQARPYLNNADIEYWCPQTLGEGLFNWWD